MLRKKDIKKTRIVRSFLLSYILILILPFAFGSFVYVKALGIIEKDAKDARVFMLKQSHTIVDNYLKDLDRTVVSMSLNTSLNTLMYMDQPQYGSSDVYYVSLTQKDLKSFNPSSTFDSNIYVFLKQSDMVLTREDTNFGIKNYYVNNFMNSNLSFDEWNKRILNTSLQYGMDLRHASGYKYSNELLAF